MFTKTQKHKHKTHQQVTSASIRAGQEVLTVLMLTHANWNELNQQPWFRSVNHRLRLTANHRFSQKLKTINFLQQVPDSSLNVLGGLFRLRTFYKCIISLYFSIIYLLLNIVLVHTDIY